MVFFIKKGTNSAPVDLKILLPDKNTISVNVRKNSSTVDVFQVAAEKIGLNKEMSVYFGLFEIVEYGFERKLQPNEFPHNLYIQNYSTAASTCLLIKKWLFTLSKEIELSREDLIESLFFWQVLNPLLILSHFITIYSFLSQFITFCFLSNHWKGCRRRKQGPNKTRKQTL